jgi:YfiH family protein
VRRELDIAGSDGPIVVWTDEALYRKAQVRVAFSERTGGVSGAGYASLNLASHVEDDLDDVHENRRRLMRALGMDGVPLVVPKQVHGERIVSLRTASAQSVEEFREQAARGADALLLESRGVAAMLCFADCVPLVIVAPSGRFTVVHAGWRGVENGIAVKALHKLMLGEPGLAVDASHVNVYRGAYIHAECFEVDSELHDMFVDMFGHGVAPDKTHIDLGRALDIELVKAGVSPDRIADVGQCTVCENARWFSYRAQGGVCGRHAALCAAL